MSTRAIFTIGEVQSALEEQRTLVDSHVGVSANSKGCGGIIDISLMIPESVILFVAPLGCARHVTTHMWQRTDRVFALALQEAEIVTGAHMETIREAVLEIYESFDLKPRLITICGSCIDRLMATDFEQIAEELRGEITSEILVTWMDPVIGRKQHPQVRCWDKAYSLWDRKREEQSVNIIGRLHAPASDSELRTLLKMSGVQHVRHMADTQTYGEYVDMGSASLNLLGSKLGEKAAKTLERRWKIPYLKYVPRFVPDIVHEMYQNIADILNIEIDDSKYYDQTKAAVEAFQVRRQVHEIHAAIGEAYAGNEDAFLIARDVAELGIQVDWIYSDGKLTGKEEQIRWLAEHQPDAKVVFLSHPGSREILLNPPEVDFAWGMSEKWFLGRTNGHWIDVEERPIDCDYASILWFLDRVEQEVH